MSLAAKRLTGIKRGSAPTYAATILAESGLQGYWQLGEASGNFANSDGGDIGTAHGGITYGVTGGVTGGGTAVTFNGTTGYISIPDSATVDLGNTFSLEAWISRGATGAARGIIGKGQDAYFLGLNAAERLIIAQGWNGDIVVSADNAVTAGWHHVVGTKDAGSAAKVYIDGADVSVTYTDRTCANNGVILAIGADAQDGTPAQYNNGSIQHVAIYNVVLTPTQVSAHYAFHL